MSIASTNRKAGPYSCNGATKAFPFAFKVFIAADVRVVLADSALTETDLVLGTHYTVALNSNQDSNPGGTVTTLTAYASGNTVTLTSKVQNLQPVVLTNNGGFFPGILNDEFDRLTILVQQLAVDITRSVKVKLSDPTSPDALVASLLAASAAAAGSATAAAGSATAAAASASLSSQHLVFVENFGAVGDGITNDKNAIQAAIDHAASLGGGSVVTGNPAKTYLVNSTISNTRRGNSLVLASGVTLDMRGGTLKRTSGYEAIVTAPVGGEGGFFPQASGGLNYATDPIITFYTMSGTYSAGGTSITLATAGDASNFAVGDYVAIRAGQLTGAAAPGDQQPIAEFNRIKGVSGGVLTLEWPLAKDYSAADNTAGAPHPYGVGRITPYVARGCAIRNTRFIVTDPTSSGSVRAVDVRGVIDFEMSGCYLDTTIPLIARGRFISIHDNHIHNRLDPASSYGSPLSAYSFAVDTGTSDVLIRGNTFTSEVATWGHIQEGVANISILGNAFLMPPAVGGTQPDAVIGAFSRSVNLRIEGNTFVNAPGNGFIHIANNNPSWLPNLDHYGLVIANNTFRGTCTAFNAIRVHQPDSGPGAVISGNHIDVTLGASPALYVHTNGPSTVTGNRLSPLWSTDFGANTIARGNQGIQDNGALGDTTVVGYGAGSPLLSIDGAAPSQKELNFKSAGSKRWAILTSGAETGANAGSDLYFQALTDAGAYLTNAVTLRRSDGSVIVGAPTGSFKGAGTINAQAVYDDGTLLTCYIIEAETKGAVNQAKWDGLTPNLDIPAKPAVTEVQTIAVSEPVMDAKGKPAMDAQGKPVVKEVQKEVEVEVIPAQPAKTVVRTHEPARRFAARAEMMLDPKQYADFWKANGHLPSMPSPDEWVAGGSNLSTGDLIQRIWEIVECQAVHIEKLRAGLVALGGAAA